MSDRIIYPSLDLFMYDLSEGLGQTPEKTAENYQKFYQKICVRPTDPSFRKILKYPDEFPKVLELEPIELLKTVQKDMEPSLDGYYYPLLIGDTLALRVDYSGKLDDEGCPDETPKYIADHPFPKLKADVEELIFYQSSTIGQTWLLWAQIGRNTACADVYEIASKCYAQFCPHGKWEKDIIGQGTCLQGELFELWHRPINSRCSENSKEGFWNNFTQESSHILIWLFPNEMRLDDVKDNVQIVQYDLMRLLQYRHKIVWSYYQSRFQKSQLKQEYVDIQPSIEKIRKLSLPNLKLKNLQKILAENLVNFSEYTIALNELEHQRHTIRTNLYNYNVRLAEITQKYAGSDLSFLHSFSEGNSYAKRYQMQIDAECASFKPGLSLFENLNSTIQGIIDLERTKSEREVDTTIAIVGISLALSGLTASAISVQSPPPQSWRDISFIYSPVFILSFGLAAPFLGFLVVRLIYRWIRR